MELSQLLGAMLRRRPRSVTTADRPPRMDGGAKSERPEIGATVDANGIKTNYLEAGRGEPVVLIHGSGPGVTSYANWRLVLPALAERFGMIAPDMGGFGFTDRPNDVQEHEPVRPAARPTVPPPRPATDRAHRQRPIPNVRPAKARRAGGSGPEGATLVSV